MPPSTTIDIKLAFEQTDMIPGPKGRVWRRNAIALSGQTDANGWSIADCLLRQDEGAVDAAGVAMAGAPAMPIGAGAAAAARLRMARLKMSYKWVMQHVSDETTLTLLGNPAHAAFQVGPEAFDYICAEIVVPATATEIRVLLLEFWQIQIAIDVGVSENSIKDSLKMLRLLNAEGPLNLTNDDIAEKLLTMIKDGSEMFFASALEEINAVEGVPGAIGVRRFQNAPVGGAPRTRNLNAMVAHYHELWSAAVKGKRIVPQAKTGRTKAAGNLAIESAMVAGENTSPFLGFTNPPRRGDMSPSRTLGELQDVGLLVRRGTVTTTDFRTVPRTELARVAEDDGDGTEFCLETCYDADGVQSIEILCNNCGGAAHIGRDCPSPRRTRSHSYMIQLHQNAMARKEEHGARQGHGEGGRRPPPRGQRQPFKSMPKRFSATMPNRQFKPAAPGGPRRFPLRREVGSEATAESEEGEHDDEGFDDSAGAATEVKPGSDSSGGTNSGTSSGTSASATDSARAAILARDGSRAVAMPTSFGLAHDDQYYESIESSRVAVEILAAPESSEEAATSSHTTVADLPVQEPGYARAAAIAFIGIIIAWLFLVAEGVRDVVHTVANAVTQDRAASVVAAIAVVWLLGRAGAHATFVPVPVPDLPGVHVDLVQPASNFTEIEKCWTGHFAGRDNGERFNLCFDSGCTCIAIGQADRWMVDHITDKNPSTGLEVASGTVLPTDLIGDINRNGPGVVVDSFRLTPDKREIPTVSAPPMTRALVTRGLKEGTRLAGVRPLRINDGIYSYFNDDNEARMTDCARLADGCYVRFNNTRNEIGLRRPRPGETIEGYVWVETVADGVLASHWARDTANVGRAVPRTDLEIHASLAHVADGRIRDSHIRVDGTSLSSFTFNSCDCHGCRLGKTHQIPRASNAAKSKGGALIGGKRGVRQPSTSGYTFFGQRVDTDMSTTLPASFPHGFTVMTNFIDRHTAEFKLYCQVGATSVEVASAVEAYSESVKFRLKDGRIVEWFTDNDLGFEGPDMKSVAARLIENQTKSIPHDKNTNPVSERNFGVVEDAVRAACCYADAPLCLWPWAAIDYQHKAYFLSTHAHMPPMSPYKFSYPESNDADMSWCRPLFCDVTVHLPKQDVHGKLQPIGADACYLGHDFKRDCQICYVPSVARIGSFAVTSWRTESFTICKQIRRDTPVEYRQPDDMPMGKATADLVPRRISASAGGRIASAQEKEGDAQEKEGDAALLARNAERILDGVNALDKEGEAALIQQAIESVQNDTNRGRSVHDLDPLERASLLLESPLTFGLSALDQFEGETEVRLHGTEQAMKVAKQFGIPKISTVAEAMASPYWELIKEAMEEEMRGKMANKAFSVVKYTGQRVMKSRWVYDFKLNEDGSIKKVKARFVACGYSQIADIDFCKTYAHTLPGGCFRLWCSIVADEDLETDSIDAVKAFTQADVDKMLFCQMAVGFAIPGYVLLMHKALEGIRQGAFLWFGKNKWAWNKCGLFSDLVEPNLYIHPEIRVLSAVFADDVGAAFAKAVEREYLAIRNEYSKLINIDSPGPETVVPVTLFTGVNIERNRANGTLTISMRKYILKLKDKYEGKITLRDFPTGKSKAQRAKFDSMTVGDKATAVDAAGYLTKLGEVAWPTNMTWPELAYYVSFLGQFNNSPQAEHHAALDHVLGYLLNDPDMGITYGGKLRVPLGLVDFPPYFIESKGLYGVGDSSWGTRPKPYGGHCVMRTNGAIHWRARALKVITDSTAHAETAEQSSLTKSSTYFRMVLSGIKRAVTGPTAQLTDNSASFDLVSKEGTSSKSRHFERATILVKYAIMRLLVSCYLVSTKFMVADIFTKATDETTFQTMRGILRNTKSPQLGMRGARIWRKVFGW